jgi:hypothetical protein
LSRKPCWKPGQRRHDDDDHEDHVLRRPEHRAELLQRIEEAVRRIDLVRRNGGKHAERAEYIERRDDHAGKDRHFRDGLAGVLDLASDGPEQLKSKQVVHDCRDVLRCIAERRDKALEAEVVGQAVFDAVYDAEGAEDQKHRDLATAAIFVTVTDSSIPRTPIPTITQHMITATMHRTQLFASGRTYSSSSRRTHKHGRHPERHVHPVIPAHHHRRLFAERAIDPAVDAAVVRVGAAQLRAEKAIRDEEKMAVMIQIVMEDTPMIAGATKVSRTRMLHTVNNTLLNRFTCFDSMFSLSYSLFFHCSLFHGDHGSALPLHGKRRFLQ